MAGSRGQGFVREMMKDPCRLASPLAASAPVKTPPEEEYRSYDTGRLSDIVEKLRR